jgi:hypothetical protein
MCVYCREDASCEHERDSCAASGGGRCETCGHTSAAVPWRPPAFPGPGPRWSRPRPRVAKSRPSGGPRPAGPPETPPSRPRGRR